MRFTHQACASLPPSRCTRLSLHAPQAVESTQRQPVSLRLLLAMPTAPAPLARCSSPAPLLGGVCVTTHVSSIQRCSFEPVPSRHRPCPRSLYPAADPVTRPLPAPPHQWRQPTRPLAPATPPQWHFCPRFKFHSSVASLLAPSQRLRVV